LNPDALLRSGQIVQRLKAARRGFDEPGLSEQGDDSRQASMYERELENPSKRLNPPPLKQPAPHVFDSAPMRPVSVAVSEGVGFLTGRGSVFGMLGLA
jgi:sorting nexin-9/18/33